VVAEPRSKALVAVTLETVALASVPPMQPNHRFAEHLSWVKFLHSGRLANVSSQAPKWTKLIDAGCAEF
jgi:hypothetical protein